MSKILKLQGCVCEITEPAQETAKFRDCKFISIDCYDTLFDWETGILSYHRGHHLSRDSLRSLSRVSPQVAFLLLIAYFRKNFALGADSIQS